MNSFSYFTENLMLLCYLLFTYIRHQIARVRRIVKICSKYIYSVGCGNNISVCGGSIRNWILTISNSRIRLSFRGDNPKNLWKKKSQTLHIATVLCVVITYWHQSGSDLYAIRLKCIYILYIHMRVCVFVNYILDVRS